MKKALLLTLAIICVVALVGCAKKDSFTISVTIPAKSSGQFAYSDEEVMATGKKITISSGEGLGDAQVILLPVNESSKAEYGAKYITSGMSAEFDAVQDEWFKVGVSALNDTASDKIVYVTIDGVIVRIE